MIWRTPPTVPTLSPNQTHVYSVELAFGAPALSSLKATLNSAELEQAARYRKEEHRFELVVSHGLLRNILARYTGCPAADIAFRAGEYGKPHLAHPAGTDLRFNMAHSHGRALYAVSRGRELGIDIEMIRPDFTGDEVARHFFSAAEAAALTAVDPARRPEAFFLCWTRKEAYIKARGEGLSFPLQGFAVSLSPDAPAELLWVEGEPEETSRWRMEDIVVAPGYAGALVAEGADWQLDGLRWEDPAALAAWLEIGTGV